MASHIPVGLSVPPRSLTPATGARTTRFDRPQRCRSSCAPLSIAHELCPPCDLMRTRHRRVHRIPRSTFVTIAIRPSWVEAGCEKEATDLGSTQSGKFFAGGLDDPNHVERLDEIRFCAHAILRRSRPATMLSRARFEVICPSLHTRGGAPRQQVTRSVW